MDDYDWDILSKAYDAAQARIAALEAEVSALLADNAAKVEFIALMKAQRDRWESIAKARAQVIENMGVK